MGQTQQRGQRTSGQMCCLWAVGQGGGGGGLGLEEGPLSLPFNPFSLQLGKLRLGGGGTVAAARILLGGRCGTEASLLDSHIE